MWKVAKIFARVFTSSGREIAVGFVAETDVWKRVFLSDATKKAFQGAVERYKDTLHPKTVEVIMKEAPHESPADQRTHFSAIELDAQKTMLATRHFPVE